MDSNIDPFIKAFDHVDERLSNVENTLGKIHAALRWNELRQSGQLENEIMGYTCKVYRHCETDSYPQSPTLRQAIIQLCCSEVCAKDHPCPCKSDRVSFASDSVFEYDCLDLASEMLCVPFDVGTEGWGTVHDTACEEWYERRIQTSLAEPFNRIFTLGLYDWDVRTMAISATQPQLMTDFVNEALRLHFLQGHSRQCIESLEIYECDTEFSGLELLKMGRVWQSLDEEENDPDIQQVDEDDEGFKIRKEWVVINAFDRLINAYPKMLSALTNSQYLAHNSSARILMNSCDFFKFVNESRSRRSSGFDKIFGSP